MTNNIDIKGRVAVEPELKFGKSGTAYLNLVVPDQKRVLNRDTNAWEDKSDTTWFRATVFGETAELLSEQVHKGTTVRLKGMLVTRSFTGGNGEQKQSLEVDYPEVSIVPTAPKADRPAQGGFGGQQQADPWSTQGQQSQQGGRQFDSAPF
jgi:single-strand DNA-binding protein